MPTYRLTVEYDGSKFLGWQVQERGRTVQGVLRETLRRLTAEPDLALHGAGRTDAGVHAMAQVASFRCGKPLRRGDTLGRLAELLPPDVAALDLRPAPDGFHARHDAEARSYVYQVTRRRSAFGKRFTWWVGALDVAAMQAGAILSHTPRYASGLLVEGALTGRKRLRKRIGQGTSQCAEVAGGMPEYSCRLDRSRGVDHVA